MGKSYWASESTESLQAALIEYEAKAPVELADVISDLYDELAERSNIFGRKVVNCVHVHCNHRFFYVPDRKFPTMCFDHAAQMPEMCI